MTIAARSTTRLALGNVLPVDEGYEVDQESIQAVREIRDVSGMRGTRSQLRQQIVTEPYRVSGEFSLAASLYDLVALLPRVLGGDFLPTDDTHTLACRPAELLPSVYLTVSRGDRNFVYTGCKFVKGELHLKAGHPLGLRIAVEGLSEAVENRVDLPLADLSAVPLMLTAAEIVLNNEAREMYQTVITIDNQAQLDRFVNSVTRVDLPIIDRHVRLSAELPYDESTLDLFTTQGIVGSASFRLADSRGELRLQMPWMRFTIASPVISGPQPTSLSVQGLAACDEPGDELLILYTS